MNTIPTEIQSYIMDNLNVVDCHSYSMTCKNIYADSYNTMKKHYDYIQKDSEFLIVKISNDLETLEYYMKLFWHVDRTQYNLDNYIDDDLIMSYDKLENVKNYFEEMLEITEFTIYDNMVLRQLNINIDERIYDIMHLAQDVLSLEIIENTM